MRQTLLPLISRPPPPEATSSPYTAPPSPRRGPRLFAPPHPHSHRSPRHPAAALPHHTSSTSLHPIIAPTVHQQLTRLTRSVSFRVCTSHVSEPGSRSGHSGSSPQQPSRKPNCAPVQNLPRHLHGREFVLRCVHHAGVDAGALKILVLENHATHLPSAPVPVHGHPPAPRHAIQLGRRRRPGALMTKLIRVALRVPKGIAPTSAKTKCTVCPLAQSKGSLKQWPLWPAADDHTHTHPHRDEDLVGHLARRGPTAEEAPASPKRLPRTTSGTSSTSHHPFSSSLILAVAGGWGRSTA